MRVGFVQTSPKFGDLEGNVRRALKSVARLARKEGGGAELIVLPELFNTGYQFKSKSEARGLAEEIEGGYTVGRLKEAAREGRVHIVAGLAELSGGKAYNSSVLVGPRWVKGVYRKAHLFSNEKRVFTPGDRAPEVYKVGSARVGMMICFDWLFPEVSRYLALKGADIICHPSNLVLPHCPDSMPVRSLENRIFAVTANRVGAESRRRGEKLRFIGRSQVTAPTGKILVRASGTRAEARVVEIDPGSARDKRITPLNDVFKDRRTDLF